MAAADLTAPAPSPVSATALPPVLSRPAPDLSENGVVRHDAVLARRWSVRGTAKVSGDVTVEAADLQGFLVVGGAFRGGRGRLRGTIEVAGPLDLRSELTVEGTLRGGTTVRAGSVAVSGTLRSAGAVEVVGTLEVRGRLEAPSLRAAELRLRGCAEISGTTHALKVEAEFDRPSALGSVEARSVRLRGRAPSPVDRLFGRSTPVSVERIEADRVELERVDVAFVRAPEIRLGAEAHVTTIEGTVVARHRTSRVGPESRSPRPPGLRR